MKTCKNCGTPNDVTVVKCVNCNLKGNFTLHVAEESTLEKESVQCNNCGHQHPGEAAHCIHCHFPLAEVTVKSISNITVELNRKVG